MILNLHNIESALHESFSKVEPWPKNLAYQQFADLARKMENQWIRKFDLVLVTSEAVQEKLLKRIPEVSVAIYPNAIPLQKQPSVEEENVIAFSGNWAYRPNFLAVKFFNSKIWPHLRIKYPELRWRLIGKNAPAIQDLVSTDTNIELIESVQDPVRELAKAKLVVVPLLSGSGTRIKILEAWAAGRAVVSTTIGAEGLPVTTGENIQIADGHAEFTKAVLALLKNQSKRCLLGNVGRKTYESKGSWPAAWQSAEKWIDILKLPSRKNGQINVTVQ